LELPAQRVRVAPRRTLGHPRASVRVGELPAAMLRVSYWPVAERHILRGYARCCRRRRERLFGDTLLLDWSQHILGQELGGYLMEPGLDAPRFPGDSVDLPRRWAACVGSGCWARM